MSEVIQALLVDEDTPASVLLVVAIDALSGELFEYEIEVIVDALEDRYGVRLPASNVDKLQAMQVIYTTNSFYMSLPVFLSVVDALNGNGVDFNYVDMPEVQEVAWAVTEVLMHLPDEDMDHLFHPDIEGLIKTLMKKDGFTKIPSSLGFIKNLDVPAVADTFLDDPMMFEAYDQNKTLEAQEVDDYVGERVRAVVQACAELPLEHRDEKSWGEFVSSVS